MARKLQLLVIHCTDTPAGRKVTAEDIKQWHQVERGWKQVGYSDMIHLDGKLENLVPFDQDEWVDPWEITNGAYGANSISRHVVYVGGANGIDTRTSAQKLALEIYVRYMLLRHPDIKICGHCKLAMRQCPSFNVTMWLHSLGIPSKNIL
jgi:hypothetical protein